MKVSLEEAFGLLSKWKSEQTPLLGIARLDGAGITFGGIISALEPYAFLVSHPVNEFLAVEIVIGLKDAQFEYKDLREAPPKVAEKFKGKVNAVLEVTLSTSQWMLHELERENGSHL